MIVLDTGYLIALAKPRDSLHARAIAWSRVVQEKMGVTEYVLWECVNHLSSGFDRAKAQLLIDEVYSDSDYEIVSATSELFQRGMNLYAARADKEWSLTDCVSFEVMRERKITQALAHDHHFVEAGFEALLRREP